MATQPDPAPDTTTPPMEMPASTPDEIVPDQGDIDNPDMTPNEDPGSPGKSVPIE